jgi:F-type H+-transporting ATPase subunit a
MGEHDTWFDFLYSLPGFENLAEQARHWLGREPGSRYHWEFMMFKNSHFTLTHVLAALLVGILIILFAARFRRSLVGEAAVVPPARFGVRNVLELIGDATLGVMTDIMGEKHAKRFFPFIGSLALFILFSNMLSLIPGFAPPTDTLKTNLALSILVFLATHIYGVASNGIGYFKHFLGPVWWLAPLMLPVELISHLARPLSLALRLMGNLAADHKVLFAFFSIMPLLLPLPFFFLGLIVAVVQTLVFCALSSIYIAMSLEHQ